MITEEISIPKQGIKRKDAASGIESEGKEDLIKIQNILNQVKG